MRILLHRGDGVIEPWMREFAAIMPHARSVKWNEGDAALPCDYAVLWNPQPELLGQLKEVKAIFLMGAGVDGLLRFGDAIPSVPLIRLGDAGMAIQMAEYVTHAVLRYFRRFDDYERQARTGLWSPLALHDREEFTIGVMGLGKLGLRVVEAMQHFGFPVRGWSRSAKALDGVRCFAGMEEFDEFLAGCRVLVSLLPLTQETTSLLDRRRLSRLPAGAYLVNVARGAQVVEPDLLELIRAGHIAGATLDVFHDEPLPPQHPFWHEPRITITPHISALTMRLDAVRQIAAKIDALEQGQPVDDIVDRNRGY
ncbi:2-hydroxyacid dehydrogenase [Massilia horti]|uniref:Glyoxylate/hydroxypyruvate reductase A n=1 Tax=Massilia horti TaxID=2562153 RepID=A0A4Y9SR03_9BURK|nr:glyoxylate/hydroxypyruvate reductase A [Massilia horti]TFW27779.1 glyoxylate/hydroxypyruvate reductase A [Massilia horti]